MYGPWLLAQHPSFWLAYSVRDLPLHTVSWPLLLHIDPDLSPSGLQFSVINRLSEAKQFRVSNG
jgi:hypothetical protein